MFVLIFRLMTMDNPATITGVEMISVYADDFATSFDFYHHLLGLADWSPMGDIAAYFRLPDERGMYLLGKRKSAPRPKNEIRTTFCFGVDSAFKMMAHLREAGVELFFEEPMQMNEETYWFEAVDPSGNIIEFLGGK